jgi:hypothetical protein
MPKTTLRFHPRPQKIFFNPRSSIGKENLQLPVVQPSIQVLADSLPTGIDPKPDRFKPMARPQRSQRLAHLRLPQVFSSDTLQTNLGAIHQQKPKGNTLHLPKRVLGLGKLAKPPMYRRVTHGLILTPFHFTRRPPKRDMHNQANRRLHRLFQITIMGLNRKGHDQRRKTLARLPVDHLGQAIANRPQELFN